MRHRHKKDELAARFLRRSVVIRELLPQDLKLEMERLTQVRPSRRPHFLAAVVGKAHARQMEASIGMNGGGI